MNVKTKPWSCPRCASRLAIIDYCDDGLTLVCSHCGYATSPTLVCPACGNVSKAEDCLRTKPARAVSRRRAKPKTRTTAKARTK